MPAQQVPSVGRIVHFVAYDTFDGEYIADTHRAAIITAVPPMTESSDRPTDVSLCVFNPKGILLHERISYDPIGLQPGTWHWPEFVPLLEIQDGVDLDLEKYENDE